MANYETELRVIRVQENSDDRSKADVILSGGHDRISVRIPKTSPILQSLPLDTVVRVTLEVPSDG